MQKRPDGEPTQAIEQEPVYQLNILINFDDVIQAIAKVEGAEWLKHVAKWEEKNHENTPSWAKREAEKGKHAAIYGFGGYHRYIVRPNGTFTTPNFMAQAR